MKPKIMRSCPELQFFLVENMWEDAKRFPKPLHITSIREHDLRLSPMLPVHAGKVVDGQIV